MNNSRTKNSLLTMGTSSLRQILSLVLTFVSRTVFIRILGAEYLGINGLFSNILSILALSELGIGTAISFYLYKPLADNDTHRIQALMRFYKTCYRVVGISILVLGSCIIPFLPSLVKFDHSINVNLYLVYFLYLFNSASSYLFFAYKQAILIANQERYKIEKINIYFSILGCVVDVVVLILLRDYIWYLSIRILLVLIKNVIIAIKIDKEYPFIREKSDNKLSKDEVKYFFKDIFSVSVFRIGSTFFNATDNIIISTLLGTIVVGYYSNYFMIISHVATAMSLITRSFTAGIGNVIAKESEEKQFSVFKQLDFGVNCIVIICTVCLFQLSNSFIKIWVGNYDSEYILSQIVVLFLCVSFYFDNTTQVLNTFREASGHFKTGRYLQLIGGIVNIVLSVILGKIYGLAGIFAATIISKGFITVLPFIIGISRNVFKIHDNSIVLSYFKKLILTLIILTVVWFIGIPLHMNGILSFIAECLISITLPILFIWLVFRNSSEMVLMKNRILSLFNKFKGLEGKAHED